MTGETKYRDAVRRVLASLPKYRNYPWEPGRNPPLGSFDGYADSIESAIYLVNRLPEALDWIESEMRVMLGMQRADGHIEDSVRRGQLQPHGVAICLHEEPRRAASPLGARGARRFST